MRTPTAPLPLCKPWDSRLSTAANEITTCRSAQRRRPLPPLPMVAEAAFWAVAVVEVVGVVCLSAQRRRPLPPLPMETEAAAWAVVEVVEVVEVAEVVEVVL